MNYPGHFIKAGESNKRVVQTIQRRLNKRGCGPITVDGHFGRQTKDAVKLFQVRSTDPKGLPLRVDAVVGPLTWGALFGIQSLPPIRETTIPLLEGALHVAGNEVGVREIPPGSNSGPRINEYLRAVDLQPRNFWCAAFVYWCFKQSAASLGIDNPLVKTGGVLTHWNKAGEQRILTSEVIEDLGLLKPGLIFIISTGGGYGHTGLVKGYEGGKLVTIEGNTSETGTGEGIGVFRLTGRKLEDINKGYLDYSRHA